MARFVVSVGKSGNSPNSDLPDIALIGPSNSGKSSLINALAKEKIALTSNKPGKTRTLNFYDFDNYYLVDTPGYGFAHGSKTSREELLVILDRYFTGDRDIAGVFQIISNHGLTDKDMEVLEYLTGRFHNYALLINKIDKLSGNKERSLFNEIVKMTNLDPSLIVMISAKAGNNLSMVNKKIREFLV